MSIRVTEDAKVLLLLCTDIALPSERTNSIQPLSAKEWCRLSQLMREAGLKSPSELMNYRIPDLGIPTAQADRMTVLLSRGGQMAVELENLINQGLWVIGLTDDEYPSKYRSRLSAELQPPLLIGAGEPDLLNQGFLGVVGSRDVDSTGADYAEQLGRLTAKAGKVIVSGMARGVDQLSMNACMEAGGKSIGVLGGALTQALRNAGVRRRIFDGQLTLVSAARPDTPFKVWNAMARNKLIYCLADYGVVVASGKDEGGTWAGAVELLKNQWIPLFVRVSDGVPPGNLALIKNGALPLSEINEYILDDITRQADAFYKPTPLPEQMQLASAAYENPSEQLSLFDDTGVRSKDKK